jgi:metal-responsive CopG/Arc/MetJ family transcriptional regulator
MAAGRRATAFRLDDELLEGLRQVYERDGILQSEQVRRAVRMWLKRKKVLGTRTERGQSTESSQR